MSRQANTELHASNRNRNSKLDLLKCLAVFLVIIIHTLQGSVGEYLIAVSRIAVPIFILITGFYYQSIVINAKTGKQIKKILFLTIGANVLYLIWDMLLTVKSIGILGFTEKYLSIKYIFKFLFLNESPFALHLWYLSAILYTLIIFWVFDKFLSRKALYYLTPILLLGDLLLGKYSLLLWNRELPHIIVRNFIFVGIPYFCLGDIIQLNKKRILKIFTKNKLFILACVFVGTTVLERYILVSLDANAPRDHYLSTTFLAISLFLLAIIPSKPKGTNNEIFNFFAKIGRDYSTMIYIIHIIIVTYYTTLFKNLGLYNVYQYITPIIVFITSTIFTIIILKVKGFFIVKK